MADATFSIIFTFSGANQTIANTVREDALADFCLARNLDIMLVDGQGQLTTTIDPAKAAAAIRADIRRYIRDVVVAYRAEKAGRVARDATEATEKTKVTIL